jgi:hypothetical protein
LHHCFRGEVPEERKPVMRDDDDDDDDDDDLFKYISM